MQVEVGRGKVIKISVRAQIQKALTFEVNNFKLFRNFISFGNSVIRLTGLTAISAVFIIMILFENSSADRPPRNSVVKPQTFENEPREVGEVSNLPVDAAEIIKQHADEIAVLKSKTIQKLQPLQDKYTKSGKLDEALAIRHQIRNLKDLVFLNVWRTPQISDIGKTFVFETTGVSSGHVWGSEVYTCDSSPMAAAVHAGALKPGEKFQVEYVIVKGLENYVASEKNGVVSQAYGKWPVAMRIKKFER